MSHAYMSRAEHLQWCKDRALEYADRGDAGGCASSMLQDLQEHPETASSAQIVSDLMFPLILIGDLNTPGKLRHFIEGFN